MVGIRMTRILAFLAVVSLAASGFGAIIVDAGILKYTAPADLDAVIDPAGMADVEKSFGYGAGAGDLDALNAFRALTGLQVMGFNTGTNTYISNITGLSANFDGTNTVDFDINANNYEYGTRTSGSRQAFSGTSIYNALQTTETQPLNAWLDMPTITDTSGSVGLRALGFCVHGRDNIASGPGQAIFSLSDGSTAAVDYPSFGGAAPALRRIFVGYVAPDGLFINGVRATRPGGGNSYLTLDDMSFVMDVPEPATMVLLGIGGLGVLIRRRRRA